MSDTLDCVIEVALFAAGEPLAIERLQNLLTEDRPSAKEIKASIARIQQDYKSRGIELVQVAGGYRFQAKTEYAPILQTLWQKKPPKYSRALLETLALIAYRQPITRGDIEEVRGVAVSTNIMKTLQDRQWIKVVGTRDVPGKPALFGTTPLFLDNFNLKSLSELPPLQDIADKEALEKKLGMQLNLPVEEVQESTSI